MLDYVRVINIRIIIIIIISSSSSSSSSSMHGLHFGPIYM